MQQFVGVNGMIKRLCMIAFACTMTNGCVAFIPDRIHYEWDANNASSCVDCSIEAGGDDFVGVAFSGGGSRAAVFAAAGAEALHRRGLLQQTTHISSVSGGSLASAYLVSMPVADCQSLPTPADREECEAAYFTKFKNTMREDFVIPMEFRQVSNINRFLSPTRRITSLQETFDNQFLQERTFGQLPKFPILLINAASYDTSQRFVFSNAIIQQSTNKTSADNSAISIFADQTLKASTFSLDGCAHQTPDDFPLSLAVASSAAFPPALGPVSIKVLPACKLSKIQYWHLGDGGILDNSGVETLQEIIVRRAQGPRPLKQAKIFAFNAENGLTPEEISDIDNLQLWTTQPGRFHYIASVRGDAYRALVWKDIEEKLDIPIEIVTFNLVDAAIDDKPWPESCSASDRKAGTPKAKLKTIPTSFKISRCNADLIEIAAKQLVDDLLSEKSKPNAAMMTN